MTQTNSQMIALKPGGAAGAKGDAGRNAAGEEEKPVLEDHAAWPMISRLPVVLSVTIPLRGLKVRDLLSLREGKTVVSGWAVTKDVPLEVGELELCWGEFEIAEQQLALRLTRLA
jgi:flagellar motor switch protein FliM